jgi:hypothetical protein
MISSAMANQAYEDKGFPITLSTSTTKVVPTATVSAKSESKPTDINDLKYCDEVYDKFVQSKMISMSISSALTTTAIESLAASPSASSNPSLETQKGANMDNLSAGSSLGMSLGATFMAIVLAVGLMA